MLKNPEGVSDMLYLEKAVTNKSYKALVRTQTTLRFVYPAQLKHYM